MADLLTDSVRRLSADGRGRSAVRQIVFLDLIAVGLEQHGGAAQLADLLLGALDHAVALAGLLVEHHTARGHLEALLGAGFGLELGHLALLCGGRHGPAGRMRSFERADYRRHGSPFRPGGGRAALWQRRPRNTTRTRADGRYGPSPAQGSEGAPGLPSRAAFWPFGTACRPHRGANTITTWRPSKRGSCSTLATLEVSSLTRLRS